MKHRAHEHRRRSGCPISFALDIFGDRWTLLVVRDIMFVGKKHFGDFLASPEKIATNILSDRLGTLQAHGIVAKRADPHNARKVIYTLTPKGLDLIPAMLELILWGARHDAHTAAPAAFVQRIKEDRQALAVELRAQLELSPAP